METTTTTQTTAPVAVTRTYNSTRRTVPTGMKLSTPPNIESIRKTHLNLDTFSPVTQNGSFEFDRVLKTGAVLKRTRKTKVRQVKTRTSSMGS